MITQGNPRAMLLLQCTVEQLDFMTVRMTSGQMSFREAKLTNELLESFVAQANNKKLQELLNPPSPPPAPPAQDPVAPSSGDNTEAKDG